MSVDIKERLVVPSSVFSFARDRYMFDLILANKEFFDFGYRDLDLYVYAKGSKEPVYIKKGYFTEGYILDYAKKMLVSDEEFELDLPIKANIGDIMYVAEPDFNVVSGSMKFSINNIQQVKVIGITGTTSTGIHLVSETWNGKRLKLKQGVYFYELKNAITFVNSVSHQSNSRRAYDMFERLSPLQNDYKYRLRCKYKFNQRLSLSELKEIGVSSEVPLVCKSFVIDTGNDCASIYFKVQFFDIAGNRFMSKPEGLWINFDTFDTFDVCEPVFNCNGVSCTLISESCSLSVSDIFNIVEVK